MQPTPYIRIIYSKGKLLLLAGLALLTIFTAFHQITTNLSWQEQEGDTTVNPIFYLKKIFAPQYANLTPTPPATPSIPKMTPEEEEKLFAEINKLPIEEVRRQLLENAPEELKELIKQGVISEEMMKELLIIMSNY